MLSKISVATLNVWHVLDLTFFFFFKDISFEQWKTNKKFVGEEEKIKKLEKWK